MSQPQQLLQQAAQRKGLSTRSSQPGLATQLLWIDGAQGGTLPIIDGRILPGLPAALLHAAAHKAQAKALLQQAGLPCPAFEAFHVSAEAIDTCAWEWPATLDALIDTAERLAAKPCLPSHGRSIHLNIRSAEALSQHLDSQATAPGDWLVEAFCDGMDIGILMVKGEPVSAVAKRAFALTGDGSATLEELIEAFNAQSSPPFQIDAEARQLMREQQAYLGEVVEAGRSIRLSNKPISGSGKEDVRSSLHPGFAEFCRRVHAVFPSPLLAIDLIAPDEQSDPAHAMIIGVDCAPDWTAYVTEQRQEEVAGLIIDAVRG